MAQISDSAHVSGLLPDYVLELLPANESDRVSEHVSRCADCRLALRQERELVVAVRESVHAAAKPDRARLRQLMPATPAEKAHVGPLAALKPGLAAFAILLIVICSTVILYFGQRPAGWTSTQPTAFSTAVIMTDTPTQTATREVAATLAQDAAFTIPNVVPSRNIRHDASQPEPEVVPVPAAPRLY